MTTNSDRASATIYTFPARGRFAANQRIEPKPPVSLPSQHLKTVAGAWYHDEAIQDAEQARKH